MGSLLLMLEGRAFIFASRLIKAKNMPEEFSSHHCFILAFIRSYAWFSGESG